MHTVYNSSREAERENCVRNVLGIERQYWQIDIVVDEVQEPVVPKVCQGKTDSEAESSDSDTANCDLVSRICIC